MTFINDSLQQKEVENNMQQEGDDDKVGTWMGDGEDKRPKYRAEKCSQMNVLQLLVELRVVWSTTIKNEKKCGIFIIKETFKITICLTMGNISYC